MSDKIDKSTASNGHVSNRQPLELCAEQLHSEAEIRGAFDSAQMSFNLPEDIDRTTSIVCAVFTGVSNRPLNARDWAAVDQLRSTYGPTIVSSSENLTIRARITHEVQRYVGQDMQTAILYDAVTHNPRKGFQDWTSCPVGSDRFASQMRKKHRGTLASFPKENGKNKNALSQSWWSECQQFVRDSQQD
jgi:hypothetical protein